MLYFSIYGDIVRGFFISWNSEMLVEWISLLDC
jgi:hypothetical protein